MSKKIMPLVVTVVAVLAIGSGVRAQQCYTPVTSWQGSYSLTANPNGVPVPCNPNGDCTVEQGVVANVRTTFAGASCTTAEWAGDDVVTTATLNDMGKFSCGENHPPMIETITGSGGGGSVSELTADLGSGTYTYTPQAWANNWTATTKACNGSEQTKNGTDATLDPLPSNPNLPITLRLPAEVQTLTAAPDPFQGVALIEGAVVPWTFSFTLNPSYNSDDCKQNGNSTIGCQTQSLGEDVPTVGTDFFLHYQSNRAPGAPTNAVAEADAAMIGGWTLSVHHAYDPNTHTLFLGDGTQRNGSDVVNPVSFNGNLLLTSEDGSEVYVFTTAGQHLKTLRPLTGALKYEFTYDAAKELIRVTDASGNVSTIRRSATEHPVAIISPYGQTTTLVVDSHGFLHQVTDPLGHSETFVNTGTGLLTSRTDQNENTYTYTYDGGGRLIKDEDQLGGYISLTRTNATSGFGWTVDQTTSMGRTSRYQTNLTLPWVQDGTKPESEQQTVTWPEGLVATFSGSLQSGRQTKILGLPDGTSVSQTLTPDPIWGLQLPVNTSETVKQGNLTANITNTRSVKLGTAGNPFTVQTATDTHTVNGRTYDLTFTGSNRTYLATSPVGRSLTITLDSLERIVSSQRAGLTAANYTYDARGRLAFAVQGARKTTFSYDANGFVASIVDPLERETRFANDADGRIVSIALPDGRVIAYSYDSNGNVISVTPPGKTAHEFSYTAVDLLSSYRPPALAGASATTYAYSLDRDLTTITRPDGEQIRYDYDPAGRLTSVVTPTEVTSYTYDATTGNLASAVKGAEHVAYSYNAALPTKSTWTGPVAGSVSRSYNNNFWIASEEINGANTIVADYDNDGLATKVGALTITHNLENGLITGTTLGVTKDTRTYNSFGELTGYTASVNGVTVYSLEYTRDADARVSAKTETIGGTTNRYVYTYDLSGRLTEATRNGAVDSYTYDTNSNRLSAILSSGASKGTYDAQDRLLTYGNASFAYTANGEMTSQTVGGRKTLYSYDVMGNLIAATLSNGAKITYVNDSENHRVGKEVNGVLRAGFLYDGGTVVAELNSSNELVSQFVHATGFSPDYMLSNGATYRIFCDQLGSPVLVVNATTGAIAERITYDEFGNVLGDTNPGFQPFGFASGLYDQDTKLLRFGARDYNPGLGRWMSKDAILFEGSDPNLYGYALSDPINLLDHNGTDDANAGTVDAGTPSNSSGGGIIDWLRETLGLVKQADEGYQKCQKGVKFVKSVSQANGTSELLTNQAEGYVKSNTGAQNEAKRLMDEDSKSVPWVKQLGDTLTSAGAGRDAADALAGKPCKKCQNQPQTPDPQPPQRRELNQWQNK